MTKEGVGFFSAFKGIVAPGFLGSLVVCMERSMREAQRCPRHSVFFAYISLIIEFKGIAMKLKNVSQTISGE